MPWRTIIQTISIRSTPFGPILLSGTFLATGFAGIVAFWEAWPRTSNTSPLAALFALVWSCTFIVTAVLTWRRSRFAAPAFLAAIGLLLFPARYLIPGSQLFLPSFAVIILVAILGYGYLRRVPAAAADGASMCRRR